ncbi:MAG: alpha-ketoacid dehydrogenase subunit beta [bacterium]
MGEKTYREAINDALREEMERDERVFILGEDVGLFGGAMAVTKGLYQRFGPKRVIDMPISESAIIGSALGSALTGLRPVAEIMFIDFTCTCMDQIVNQVAKIRYMLGGQVTVPLVIRTQGGAGKSYAAQHSQSLESWFANVPGMKVVMPSTPYDAKGLLKSAIRDDNPVMFIEHKLLYNTKGEVPDGDYTIPIGVADVKREGRDVTITSHSRMTLLALEAAGELEKDGIDAEVVDLRTISPLDMGTIAKSVKKTGRLVTVEEGCRNVGIGAEVAARVVEECFDYLDAPVRRVAALDTPIPCNRTLERAVIPEVEDIIAGVKKLFNSKALSNEK